MFMFINYQHLKKKAETVIGNWSGAHVRHIRNTEVKEILQ